LPRLRPLLASITQNMHSSNRFLLLSFRLAVAILIGLWAFNSASAQVTVATDPVGFTTTSLLGGGPNGSDTFVSIPFIRPPEFIGAIASATTPGTIAVAGTPFTASQFKYVQGSQSKHYYVLVGSGGGTKEGRTYPITDNTNNSLTVTTTAYDDASGIPANAQVTIIPYWTPATIFPASDAGISFTVTTTPPNYQTLIRVPDYSAAGTGFTYATEYYFNSGAWQRVSGGDGSDDPLLPDGYFVVRNSSAAPTLPLTNIGSVLLKKLSVYLATSTTQAQNNPVSMVRPLNVALDATGLSPTDNSFGGGATGDKLLLFDNAAVGIDKSPSAIYTYDTHWRLSGDSTSSDRGADIVPAGTGFVVQKAANTQAAFWTNAFPVSALSAVSRKMHGSNPFDVPLPLGGTPGIECRLGGVTQVVFTFPAAVTVNTALGTQGASVTSGVGSVSGVSGSGTTTVTVNLAGVTNRQYVTVTLLGVSDGVYTNDVAARAGVLLGDVNATKSVDGNDVSAVQGHTRQSLNITNFRYDVNITGSIDGNDVSATQAATRTSIP
jgi:uncharacterized protein (TIGR02597 family)